MKKFESKMRSGVSVCLATFNGATYLKNQLDSIFSQIQPNDEVIIVDDCSTDNTVSLIKEYDVNNIKLFVNDRNYGHVKAFETALSLATNDIILLSDQDDVWLTGRLNLLIDKCKNEKILLFTSNFGLIDESGLNLPDPKFKLHAIDSSAYIRNIMGIFLGKRPYYGCAMIIRRRLLDFALPFSTCVEGHDVWLAFCANVLQSSSHLEQKTINRRLHSNNLTAITRRPFFKIALTRYRMFICIIIIIFRLMHRLVRPRIFK